ncbi:MAG: class I adenylate-forming enzyme family protein [Thermoanaerobaculum sp.]
MVHADFLGERARLTPEKQALVDLHTGQRYTYRQLNDRARYTAGAFSVHLHVQPGDRVAVLLHNRVELLDLYFAAAKGSFVFVPLNPRLAVPELVKLLQHAEPEVLVYEAETAEKAEAAAKEVQLRALVPVDNPAKPKRGYWSWLLNYGPELVYAPPPQPEDLLAILYTSGTTGEPKGVMIPHRMVAFDAWATVLGWQLREDDVSPIFTPLYHAGGLFAFLTPILAIGGTIVLHRTFDPEQVWTTIQKERCTVVLGVPTIWRVLADHPSFASVSLEHVRWFISGGAPLPVSLIERYRQRGVVLRQGYGLTEVGVNCFAMTNEDAWRKAGSIGKPLPFTQAKIVDEDNCELPAGEVGELCLAGPHVCAGYYKNPEATAEVFDSQGFFRTGDLAYHDEEGFFYIVGRKKEMFISGGVNIFPAEIEAVLLEHPQVADAAVVGVPDEVWGEKGVAFVVPKPGGELAAEALVAFLKEKIAAFKVPKEFCFVGSLPRTAYGKVVRRELVVQWQRRQG